MGQADQSLHRSRPARSQREQQLRFEPNVGEFVGHVGTAKHHEALATGGRFECPVVDDTDKLGADDYMEA